MTFHFKRPMCQCLTMCCTIVDSAPFEAQLAAQQLQQQALLQQQRQQQQQQLQHGAGSMPHLQHPAAAAMMSIPGGGASLSSSPMGSMPSVTAAQASQDVDMANAEAVVAPIVIHNPKEPVSLGGGEVMWG